MYVWGLANQVAVFFCVCASANAWPLQLEQPLVPSVMPSYCRWFATCGATPQVAGEGGAFVTEDQGVSWGRIFNGGPGQQQSKDFAKGQGYAIGLAVNPFRQGELIVTAGDRPPGDLCMVGATCATFASFPILLCMQRLSTKLLL